MSQFGEYLIELRGGKSLREVTKGTGISYTYLSTLEKGFDPRTNKERKPTPGVLKKLSSFYQVSYEELLSKAGYLDQTEAREKLHKAVNKDEAKENFNNFETTGGTVLLRELLLSENKINYKGYELDGFDKESIIAVLDIFFKERP
ncbi:helix-turn-helix domain-containing protein [Litchfieldia alkalitelluris]|uniref:helix-turn-helix domain-containing protein n=1 Tax=Litchfieldia alkalitelluris TaxID=304268 RepID=UPI000997E804|nr:helix-turn-helix transcriptional regulator [Litchfieldia alkalitelluris]